MAPNPTGALVTPGFLNEALINFHSWHPADTLYIMAGLGLVERVDEDCFVANAITRHMVDMPSAQHGAVHL